MKNEEFIKLMEHLQKKNLDALEIIYREYFLRIYTTAFLLVKNEQDAYDIAMNVIFKLIRYEGDPKTITRHTAWLGEIAKNEALDFIRKRQRVVVGDVQSPQDIPLADTLWLNDILKTLNDEEQEIFTAHFIWDQKLKEIAQNTQKPYIRVKRVFAEVKRKVQELYREEGWK